MKKILCTVLAIIMTIGLCACSQQNAAETTAAGSTAAASGTASVTAPETAASVTETAQKPVMLRISISETATDYKAGVLQDFMTEVQEATNGAITFEIYYSNELGTLADMTEQIAMGANILTGSSGDFFADYGCYDIISTALQYALPTADAVQKMNDSDLFASWCDKIEESSGLKILCCNWAAAPRSVLSTKPINSVADFKGLKVRVPGAAADAFFSALGAATMTMAFSDIYANMQQGMVEACEAPLGSLYAYSLFEVAHYGYLSEHSLAPACWALSADIWNSLSEENQKILQEAMVKYGKIYTEKGLETQAEYKSLMEKAGVTFVEPSDADKQALQAAGAASFDAFPDLTPGLADTIAKIIA